MRKVLFLGVCLGLFLLACTSSGGSEGADDTGEGGAGGEAGQGGAGGEQGGATAADASAGGGGLARRRRHGRPVTGLSATVLPVPTCESPAANGHTIDRSTLGGLKALAEAYHPQVIANAGAKLPIIT